jgi:hypothetical protein
MEKELAQRENDGITIILVWDTETDRLGVSVVDRRAGEAFTLPVDAAAAMDVFHHPYAHAARQGVHLAATGEPVYA